MTNKAANENHLKNKILCSALSIASELHQAAVSLLLLYPIFHNPPYIKFLKEIVYLEGRLLKFNKCCWAFVNLILSVISTSKGRKAAVTSWNL